MAPQKLHKAQTTGYAPLTAEARPPCTRQTERPDLSGTGQGSNRNLPRIVRPVKEKKFFSSRKVKNAGFFEMAVGAEN